MVTVGVFQVPDNLYAQAAGPEPIGIIVGAGDIAKCNPDSGRDEETAKLLDAAVTGAEKKRIPIKILALGDLAYDNGTEQEFKCFDASWGSNGKKQHILPVPGNHDYRTSGGAPFFAYFKEELADLYKSGASKEGYYVLRFPDKDTGPWLLVGLNAYAGLEAGSDQLKWLDEKLKASSARCILAFAHPFRFSSGLHGHKDSVKRNAKVVFGSMIKSAYEVLHIRRASLLLTGHDHSFEQFARQDVHGKKSDDGVRSFVIGTGGAGLYNSFKDKNKKVHKLRYDNMAPNSEKYDQDSQGILKIELFADRYRWQYIPIAGDNPINLPAPEDTCNIRP